MQPAANKIIFNPKSLHNARELHQRNDIYSKQVTNPYFC